MGNLWRIGRSLLRGYRSAEGDSSSDSDHPPVAAVICACGFVLTTRRAEYRQIVPCPQCEAEIFVYPRSPYPQPRPPRRKPEPPKEEVASPAGTGATTEPVTRGRKRPPRARPRPDQGSEAGVQEELAKADRTESTAADRSAAVAAAVAEQPRAEPVPRLEFPRRPWWQRKGTIAAAIALFVLVAAVISVRQARKAAYRRALVEHWRAAQEALKEGDLAAALTSFEQVHQALVLLGEDSPERSAVAHLTLQALAIRDLAPQSPQDLFAGIGTPGWDVTFERTLKGRSVLVEAVLQPEGEGYRLDLVSFAGDSTVHWAVPRGSELDRAEVLRGQRVVIAGYLDRTEEDGDRGHIVRLEPDSLRLLTSIELLRAVGWPVDALTEEAVERQAQVLFESEGVERQVADVRQRPPRRDVGLRRMLLTMAARLLTEAPVASAWSVPCNAVTPRLYVPLIYPAQTDDRELFAHELRPDPQLFGRRLRVYGKFKTRIQRVHLRLEHCSVPFVIRRPDLFPRGQTWLYVIGVLERQNGSIVFRADEVRPAPSPAERVSSELRAVGQHDVTALRRLLERVRKLAELYDEADLRNLEKEIERRIRSAELVRIDEGDYESLLAYVRRYERQLDEDTRRILLHRAALWMIEALEKRQAARSQDWLKVAERIKELFPRSAQPAPSARVIEPDYLKDPDQFYQTHPQERHVLERLLLARVYRHYLARRAEEVAEPGLLAVAEEAQRLLPEYPELTEALLNRWLDAQRRRLGELSRSELADVLKVVRERPGDEPLALELHREWLRLRERRLAPDDAVGRLALAREYQDVLKDPDEAARLLLEAIALDESLQEARDRLLSLGYRLRRGQWLTPDGKPVQLERGSPGPSEGASRGLPSRGDLPEDVRRILGGDPGRVARLGTASGVLEQWYYATEATLVVVEFRALGSLRTVQAVHVLRTDRTARAR